MSARNRKNKTEADETGRAFYVYLVGERAAIELLFDGEVPQTIESAAPPEMIINDDLAAVTSEVPLSEYGEEALQARLTDPTWTALRTMRHEKVVEHFASRASIIPLRFGTIYLRRERVREMIEERRGELRAIIERLRGREEWGVNISRDRAKLLETIVTVSPRLRELSEQAAKASPGQAYLLRKKIDAMRADEARAETLSAVSEIERKLARASEGAARLRLLKDEAGEQGDVVAKLAFLVEREQFDRFRAAAEALAGRYIQSGFRIEMTGPWPAYNFASTGERREGDGDDKQ
jgi:Gas vesicle synthesis protein GvpL/GvpF